MKPKKTIVIFDDKHDWLHVSDKKGRDWTLFKYGRHGGLCKTCKQEVNYLWYCDEINADEFKGSKLKHPLIGTGYGVALCSKCLTKAGVFNEQDLKFFLTYAEL